MVTSIFYMCTLNEKNLKINSCYIFFLFHEPTDENIIARFLSNRSLKNIFISSGMFSATLLLKHTETHSISRPRFTQWVVVICKSLRIKIVYYRIYSISFWITLWWRTRVLCPEDRGTKLPTNVDFFQYVSHDIQEDIFYVKGEKNLLLLPLRNFIIS
jgi:hypothetical protein